MIDYYYIKCAGSIIKNYGSYFFIFLFDIYRVRERVIIYILYNIIIKDGE